VTAIERVTVTWPDGTATTVAHPPAGQVLRVPH
jgi:hypothetical protein